MAPPPLQQSYQLTTSRRGFFGTTTTTTAAAVAASCLCVNQAAFAASNDDIYVPPPGSLRDKVILITGGTSGLGLESAKRLAGAGATIILTARTQQKGDAAVAQIKQYLNDRQVGDDDSKLYAVPLDLDSLQNVKSFASRLPIKHIDVLINNAGVMAIPTRQLTEDGNEQTFQSNHLGHFVLTATLAPFLAKDARVINVSSMAYLIAASPVAPTGFADLNVNKLNLSATDYGPWKAYGISKLENILFTQELQRRVDETQGRLRWTAVTLHPGTVQTNLARYLGVPVVEDSNSKATPNAPFWQKGLLSLSSLFLKTVEQGASTQIYLAAAPANALHGGGFYVDCREQPLVPAAKDPSLAKALWDASERLGGVSFPLK